MEDKKLNFNQPILSVRRFSSTVASEKDNKRKTGISVRKIPSLPTYKSELKSGPVSNAGTVPFVWEQSPGRPKGESKAQTQGTERPPIAPNLPPGRILKSKQESDNRQGKVHDGSHNVSSWDKNLTKFESAKDTMDQESSDSGNGDETYLDALDSLSRTESFFLNCSVSGASGFDGPDVKPCRTFSTDPQTKDFMMGRFLPAAKAMVAYIPKHPPRKQAVVWEQPREVKKVVSGNRRPPLRYGPNILPDYAQEDVEEDSDDDFNEDGKLAACGLLPRFCLKGRLLNPIPGMSVRTRVPMSVGRTQTNSSSAGFYSESENEQIKLAAYDKKSIGEPKVSDFREDKSVSENGSNGSRSNSHELEGSTLYRRLQGNGMSLYRNEMHQSHLPEQREFCNIPRATNNSGVNGCNSRKVGPPSFQELLAVDQNEIDSGNPVVEKTLYVDMVHKVESPKLTSYSPDMKASLDLKEKDFDILAKCTGMEETHSIDSSVEDMNKLNNGNSEAILQPDVKAVQSSLQSSANKSYLEMGMDRAKICGKDDDFYHGCITSADIKLRDKVQTDSEVRHRPKEDSENSSDINSDESFFEFPAPPPLPKTPSDSWLGRTLPSMSKKKTHLRPFLGYCPAEMNHGNQAFKQSLKKEQLTTIPEFQ